MRVNNWFERIRAKMLWIGVSVGFVFLLGSGCATVMDESPTAQQNDETIHWQGGAAPSVAPVDQGETRLATIYFAYNQSILGETERQKLEAIAREMLKDETHDILIEGHCDERGSEEYNRALGEQRALSVRNFLIAAGIGPERIHTISYGEEKPAVPGHTEEAYRLNRRAEILLVAPRRVAENRP